MRTRDALLERDFELGALSGVCAGARDGEGAVLAVRGSPGIGKTALLDHVAGGAIELGLTVLRASGSELERELGYGVVRQLLEPAVRGLSEAAREELLQGAAALAVPVLFAPEQEHGRPDAVRAALHGLYWLTVELAARGPLLLVVDDAHWADAASLRWLAYLARRLHGAGISLVMACRDMEPGADMDLLRQVLSEAGAGVLDPQTLSEGAAREWLTRAYGRSPSEAFARACWGVTGGNPFLLGELAAALRDEGLEPDDDAVRRVRRVATATIGRSVLTRLARLGTDAVAVAETVAILSSDARLDLVVAVSTLSVDQAAAAADRLTLAGILTYRDVLGFAHPVLATAVYDQMPAVRRGLAHAAAAMVLLERGAEPERAASHLLLAPPRGHPGVADVLHAAGVSATARGAPESATHLLRRALAEPPRERHEVLVELAQAEATVRDPAALARAREAVATARTPTRRARAAVVAADTMLNSGLISEALELLQATEREAGEVDHQPTLRDFQAMSLMAASFHQASGISDRLRVLEVDRLEGATAAERAMLAVLAFDLTVRAEPCELAVAPARRLLAREDLDAPRWDWVPCVAARVLGFADHVDEARVALTQLIEGGQRRGAVLSFAYASALRAEVELHAGRPASAESDARYGLELALEHGLWSVPGALAMLAEALLVLGSPSEALAAISDHGFDAAALRDRSVRQHWSRKC